MKNYGRSNLPPNSNICSNDWSEIKTNTAGAVVKSVAICGYD
jgi:hypothetical protein